MRRHPWIALSAIVTCAAWFSAPMAARPKQVQGAAAQAPAPAASEIIAKFVQALGGADAQKRISSIHASGSYEIASQGLKGAAQVLSARPDKSLLTVDIANLGHIETGFNGTVGWSIDPIQGPMLLKGEELTETKDDAYFDAVLHDPSHVRSMRTVGRATFDGRPAWQVHVVLASGTEQDEYYDPQTYLQMGTSGVRHTAMGALPVTSYTREYKKFGALMQPTVLVQQAVGFDQTVTLTSFEYDVVAKDAFDPPPAIKALIK